MIFFVSQWFIFNRCLFISLNIPCQAEKNAQPSESVRKPFDFRLTMVFNRKENERVLKKKKFLQVLFEHLLQSFPSDLDSLILIGLIGEPEKLCCYVMSHNQREVQNSLVMHRKKISLMYPCVKANTIYCYWPWRVISIFKRLCAHQNCWAWSLVIGTYFLLLLRNEFKIITIITIPIVAISLDNTVNWNSAL